MKRRFAILAAAFALFAFLALPMGMKGQTRAEVVSYTLEPVAGSNNSYTGNCDIAIDGITWNLTGNSQQIPWRIGGKNLTEVNRPLYSKTAISDNISKIEVTHGTALNITVNSWTVIVASDANFSNIISTFTPDFEASSTTTINRPDNADWSNCYYKFVYNVSVSGNTNRFVQFTQAKFYKQEGSGPAVATPTFSPAGGEYITEQNVTISCETQGATIYYTTDDSAPDNTSTQYTTAIPVSSTTTIKAIAYVGTDASSVGTATYSIVQPLNTMQAIFDKATEVGGTATYVYITMNNWVVSGVSTNGKNVFVTDGTKGFIIYDGGGNMGFSVGDILSGTVYCKVQLYNGSAELTLLNSTTSGLSIATGGTVTAANIAMADLAGVNTGALVHYDNLTCSIDNNKYYLSDGTTTLQVYNTLYAFGSTFVADHVYNITGVYQQFNNSSNETKEVLPRSADDIEEVATGNPNITAEDVNIAYNATSGTIAYTIENEVAGGSLTATTESDWLTLGTVGTTVPFTCSANATASPRTASVTLTYTYNTDQFVTKNVTVTQAGNSNIVNSISDITAEGEYTVQGTIVAINNRGFVLGDGTGYVYYYYGENFEYGDYDIGDMVKLSGPVVVYGGVFEFNNTTEITYVSESNYVGGDPIVLSGAEMDARVASTTPPQLSSYVQYEGTLTVSGNYYNITNIAGATTAKGSISYPLNGEEIAALNGKQVIVTGYYVGVSSNQYYNTMIGSVVESTEPAITLTPNEINVGSEGGRFGVAVTLSNITFGANPSFNIPVWDEFYEWIHFEEVNLQELDSICFTLDPNTTDTQRSFYFELRIIPDLTHPSQVYSNQVTVTQEAYVAPTYAELPFEFNGGKSDIEDTDGLYQEGLGTDYTSENASNTKLKFDSTGDWLLLQFNERPGTLTFDIKGNPGSGDWAGTFILQTSEDGVTYTDLETYTELANTVQHESFSDLGENVRYIKWIFVTKDNGNVGLGNIVLQPYVAPQEYTLTVTCSANIEIFTFIGDSTDPAVEGATTQQVTNGTEVGISVSATTGYTLTLVVDGIDVTSQLDETGYYTFYMPTHDVTVTATAIEYVAGNYVRISDLSQLTDGCKVIIAARYDEDHTNGYYAMPGVTSGKPTGVAFTSETSGTDEILPATITNSEDTYYWTVNVTEDGYTFTNADDQMIGYSSSTNFATNNNTVWTIARETAGNNAMVAEYTGFVITNDNTDSRAFAFNGTAFGAYAKTNMNAAGYNFYLDFFVQTAGSETVTQTVELFEGWNWFSTYIELDDPVELLQMLENGMGESGIQIEQVIDGVDMNGGDMWAGDLMSIGLMNEHTYMIEVMEDVTVELQGPATNPADHPITIYPGEYSWIGFPCAEEVDVNVALAGFDAEDGDMIETVFGEEGGIIYYYGGVWVGDFDTMVPGRGYIYFSNSDEEKTLIIQTELSEDGDKAKE